MVSVVSAMVHDQVQSSLAEFPDPEARATMSDISDHVHLGEPLGLGTRLLAGSDGVCELRWANKKGREG